MAYGDPTTGPSLSSAFNTASQLGFKLFFSFDYAGNGRWPKGDVLNLLNQYAYHPAYFQHNGQPMVSTFEGPESANDWHDIKAKTGCFFVPSYSSLGAQAAMELGVADGLFSWAGWPNGNTDMNTFVDASYMQFLKSMPYMMPVSPWFYTNLPGYNKNWLWRGDDLWYDRWQQALFLQPEFIEIISWNDYGESHYIGPVRGNALGALNAGRAPFNYVTGMPHDAWRQFLPFVIDTYKTGNAAVTREGLTSWFRPQPAKACSDGGTTGNTASQLQVEYAPSDVAQDRVFFSALLASAADVSVSIGGASIAAKFTDIPDGGIGIYHGSVATNGATGAVVITISRNGNAIAKVEGSIGGCTGGFENWNAWVGGAQSTASVSATPALPLERRVCVAGTSVDNFLGLCDFSCSHGYCPIGACVCTAMGAQRMLPNATGVTGYPLEGESPSYLVSAPLSTPTVSEFAPPACVAGSGTGALTGLCSFSCSRGFCPRGGCTCTQTGPLNLGATPPPVDALPVDGLQDYGLCEFTCARGYCPDGACTSSSVGAGNGTGNGNDGGVIYYPPSIWQNSTVSVTCDDCTIVLPPSPLPTPIVVTYTVQTAILVSTSGTTSTSQTTFALPPFTISSVPFWPITIQPGATQTTFTPLQSIMPPSTVLSLPSNIIIAPPRSGTYLPYISHATATPAPGNHPANSVKDCSYWYQDVDGDTCVSIANKFSMPPGILSQLNPDLGSSCNLVVGNWYCIQEAANNTVVWLTPPTFFSSSHTATVQPPATQSVKVEPPIPPIIYFPPPPVPPLPPVCIVGCGILDCALFGCGGGCGVFGCDGGCGIDFCGGGCAAGECGPGCGSGDCAIYGGGGGSYPPPPGPPPGPLPPTDDADYEPPATSCDLIDTPVVLPPGAGNADVDSGPGVANGPPQNPTSSNGPSSTRKPTGSSTSARPPPPTSSGGSQGGNQGSCYFDSTDARALPNQASVSGGVTIEGCKAACSAQGFELAGVEYGVECWCGNSISNGQTTANPTDCNMPCAGNSAEICGSGNRINIYQISGQSGATATSAPAHSTPTATSSSAHSAPTATCPSASSPCDANNCAGQYNQDGSKAFCTEGNFRGCQCTPTTNTCGPPQSCDLNSCNGQWDGQGVARCTSAYNGCECQATNLCGAPQSCDINGCNGQWDSQGVARCTGAYKGCQCQAVSLCGTPQSCDLNGCNGQWDNQGVARCSGSYNGCECKATSLCGVKQDCNANGCNGQWDGQGVARCTGAYNGCECQATSLCGSPQSCDINGCNGQWDGQGVARCTGTYQGCECQATSLCGAKQDCNLNGCNGQWDGQGVARCTGAYRGCECQATSLCGSPQSCDINGCNGGWDSQGVARCTGAYQGCQCIVSSNTCGPQQSCDLNGCNGGWDGQGVARCRGAYQGCQCIATANTCGPQQSCALNGCNGVNKGNGQGVCTGAYWGCSCILPVEAPYAPDDPPPSHPSPPKPHINVGIKTFYPDQASMILTWVDGNDVCSGTWSLMPVPNNPCGIQFCAGGFCGLTLEGCGFSDLWINQNGGWFMNCAATNYDYYGNCPSSNYLENVYRNWACFT
ncbi:glycoside hydrolase, family 71 [Trichoderma arundinaceum]|uniref:Glycoside hydrolase, family 71 n=1 Tax=Trichoderma arundinaceum TaxID=490622 RepID=A0A395P1T9_TRIAR|nr:glycoside hydrolase, family 71 [Trichoderma arundinaceum]